MGLTPGMPTLGKQPQQRQYLFFRVIVRHIGMYCALRLSIPYSYAVWRKHSIITQVTNTWDVYTRLSIVSSAAAAKNSGPMGISSSILVHHSSKTTSPPPAAAGVPLDVGTNVAY